MTGDEHAKDVLIEAAESLVDRYNEGVSYHDSSHL